MGPLRGRGACATILWLFLATLPSSVQAEDSSETCDARGGGNGCVAPAGKPLGKGTSLDCAEKGFDSLRLSCSTCRKLESRLQEQAGATTSKEIVAECLGCCR